MIRVIIADDHAVIRKGLDLYMRMDRELTLVAEAADGDELLELLKSTEADVLLLDIDMPRMNGITALRQLVEVHPGLKVIILSMHPEELYAVTVRKMGAKGYLSKDAEPAEVLDAIKKVHGGGEAFNQEVIKVQKGTVLKDRKIKLSEREIEVLKLLSAGKSNKDISEELGISDKTVSTYKQRLLAKTGARSVVDLINFAKA